MFIISCTYATVSSHANGYAGTGKGTSVLEMIKAFEAASGVSVLYKMLDRRPGDSVAVWAATELAEQELGWKAKLGIHDMCRDQWAWAQQYPQGYDAQS